MTAQATQQLLQQNDVFFVDTLPGHRALNKLKEVMGVWMSDTVSHDSHLLVKQRWRTIFESRFEVVGHEFLYG